MAYIWHFACKWAVSSISFVLVSDCTKPHPQLSRCIMMTSTNGNIFRVTSLLSGEFIGHRWIPLTYRPVTRSFDVFFDLRLNKRSSKQSRHHHAHYDVTYLISASVADRMPNHLWRHWQIAIMISNFKWKKNWAATPGLKRYDLFTEQNSIINSLNCFR